ncbi:hypothetical protein [Escherichia sp. E1130]|uniref:hypothetical protein n=1 Tax=Escherichia sp. E1130 TaxID=2041645 RepID=UPI001436845A|nr:hypothetical protein [Escherichia sp. E1130]
MNNEQAQTAASIPELVSLIIEAEPVEGAEMNNAERSALAAEVLCIFARRTGQARDGEPVETIMVDLLANLMHLCDRMSIDFRDCCRLLRCIMMMSVTPESAALLNPQRIERRGFSAHLQLLRKVSAIIALIIKRRSSPLVWLRA